MTELKPGDPPIDPRISFVIPTLNEENSLPDLLKAIGRAGVPAEVIVCDGGSTDGTEAVARAAGARWIAATGGRGAQLRAGAEAARSPLLAFLHADARLSDAAVARIKQLALDPPEEACVFRFAMDGERWIYRVLEAGTHLRAKYLSLPYGDQGLIVRATAYWSAGGHPAIPLMEDVAISRQLSRTVGIRVLPEKLPVSTRRWERDGALRRSARNLSLVARYLLGVSPDRLARRYRPEPSPDE